MSKIKFKNIFKHLHKIYIHRKYVRHYCFLAGIPWRGITHDLSKYSPAEFWESVKFYQGNSSPINAAKKEQGYSKAWLHHRGRNRHHWAYWTDNFSEGFTVYPMPKNDFVELVCDFLGAARAYNNNKTPYAAEYEWWLKDKEKGNKAMHKKNKKMLDIILSDLTNAENGNLNVTPEQLIKSGYIQEVWSANN